MAHYWVIIAILLFVLELFTGTIYLLVLSVAWLLSAAVAWLFGANAAMICTAILSLLGCVAVWHRQQSLARKLLDNLDNDDLDMGQTVLLEYSLPNGDWQVLYRGTLWEARANHQGSLKKGNTAQIIGRDGNLLLIK